MLSIAPSDSAKKSMVLALRHSPLRNSLAMFEDKLHFLSSVDPNIRVPFSLLKAFPIGFQRFSHGLEKPMSPDALVIYELPLTDNRKSPRRFALVKNSTTNMLVELNTNELLKCIAPLEK